MSDEKIEVEGEKRMTMTGNVTGKEEADISKGKKRESDETRKTAINNE